MDQSIAEFDFLECPICFRRMTNIAFLATEPDEHGSVCTHSFCFECITDTLSFNERNGKLLKACPLCRREVQTIGKNLIADQLAFMFDKFYKLYKRESDSNDGLRKQLLEVEEAASKVNDITEQLTEMQRTSKELSDELNEERAKRQEVEHQLQKERQRMEELQQQKQEERIRLTKSVVSVREEAEELRTMLEAQQETNKNITSQLEDQKRQSTQETERLKEELAELKEEFDDAKEDWSAEKERWKEELKTSKTELQRMTAEKQRNEADMKIQLQQEIAKSKSEIKKVSESFEMKLEEARKLKNQNEELHSKLVLIETKSKEHLMRLEKEKKKLEEQQRRLEERIADLETRVVAAERDSKMFADMYESTKSSLKEKELQLHQLRRHSKSRTTPHLDMSGDQGMALGIMDMVKTANTGLLSSISKNWWGSQSAPAQVEHMTNRSYEKLPIANFNDYALVEKRGSSKTSNVWKARELSTKRIVALKRKALPASYAAQQSSYYYSLLSSASSISQLSVDDQIQIFREAMLLSRFSHPNIVKAHAIIQQPKEIYVVMNFVEYDLEYWYSQHRATEDQIKDIFFQILLGLYYIHSAECVHRNLTPSSILLSDSQKVRLAGFSSAFSLFSQPIMGSGAQHSSQMSSSLAYLRYCAPELIYNPQIFMSEWNYWKEADVWSAGCVLAEVFLRHSLFGLSTQAVENTRDDTMILRAIYRISDCRPTTPGFVEKHPILKGVDAFFKSGEGGKLEQTNLKQLLPNAPPQALDLLSKMLQIEYHKRIDVITAIHHPWFSDHPLFSAPKHSCHFANELSDDDVPHFVANAILV